VVSRAKSSNSMITKVVLGVALVLIECSIITSSQNSSLSVNNDPFNATDMTVNVSNFSTSEAKTLSDFLRTENSSASITNSDTSTTIKLKIISNFTTTLSPDTSVLKTEPATTLAPTTTDFHLPENCSAYKVRISTSQMSFIIIVYIFILSF
jgi:hypothetical protein